MATQITIHVEGLDAAVAKLTPARADGPIGRFLDRGATYIQSRAKENAPVDTGRLRGSIGVNSPSPRMREIGANTDYAEYVETGTRPHFPPVAAITPWAVKHGIEPTALAWAISRRGTKAQPYMKPAAEAGESFVKTLVPVLAAELEAAYAGGD